MSGGDQQDSRLLNLPDPCLLAVLCCCADDPRSLFSAARAHSRLKNDALQACNSLKAVLSRQEQVDSVLQYLADHGQHVGSINLESKSPALSLRELPHYKLQGLSSLFISGMSLQLEPADGSQGVIGNGVPLKQLQIHDCKLLRTSQVSFPFGERQLAAALSQLPELRHLSLTGMKGFWFQSSVLQGLQHLTHLQLERPMFSITQIDYLNLQHLQGMTGLQDLRVESVNVISIQAGMMSGLGHLTHLMIKGPQELSAQSQVEPGALAGKTKLQHLEVWDFKVAGGSAGITELLSHLQHLQQLTHLDLRQTLRIEEPWHVWPPPPAAAYSALTASSKLQYLHIIGSTLPAGVWQHVFPAGRQLPHLWKLFVSNIVAPAGAVDAPEGSRVVGCCPGLRELGLLGFQCSTELLAPLTGLAGLTMLALKPAGASGAGLEVVRQLTGLRCLCLWAPSEEQGLLLQLTKLKQLIHLRYDGRLDGVDVDVKLSCEAPSFDPVWKQIAWHHSSHSDPAVVQQAAAGLAEYNCWGSQCNPMHTLHIVCAYSPSHANMTLLP